MPQLSQIENLTNDYDLFLSASVAEQANGTPVSLLSALIRSDYDPWEEAARLAKLPNDRAQRALVGLLNDLLDGNAGFAECENLAKKLVQLLPLQTFPHPLTSRASSPKDSLPLLVYWVIWVGFVMLLTLAEPHGHRTGAIEQAPQEASQGWRRSGRNGSELAAFGHAKTHQESIAINHPDVE